MARKPPDDSEETVISVRMPKALVAQVDARLPVRSSTWTRSRLLRRLVEAGLATYTTLEPDPAPPAPDPAAEPPGRPPRIRERPWAARVRELHAQGLSVDQIAEALGEPMGDERERRKAHARTQQKLWTLRLKANKVTVAGKGDPSP